MRKIDMTYEELQTYMSVEIAYFCRDNMFRLEDHPMDYDDHFDYIVKIYNEYVKERGKL